MNNHRHPPVLPCRDLTLCTHESGKSQNPKKLAVLLGGLTLALAPTVPAIAEQPTPPPNLYRTANNTQRPADNPPGFENCSGMEDNKIICLTLGAGEDPRVSSKTPTTDRSTSLRDAQPWTPEKCADMIGTDLASYQNRTKFCNFQHINATVYVAVTLTPLGSATYSFKTAIEANGAAAVRVRHDITRFQASGLGTVLTIEWSGQVLDSNSARTAMLADNSPSPTVDQIVTPSLAVGTVSEYSGIYMFNTKLGPKYSNPVFFGVTKPFRCDTVVKATIGCVARGDAELHISQTKAPAYRAHVQAAIASGLPARLHLTADESQRNANGAKACPKDGSLPRPEGLSCDEYPFRSTHEGAASANGQASGARSFPDCQMPDPP